MNRFASAAIMAVAQAAQAGQTQEGQEVKMQMAEEFEVIDLPNIKNPDIINGASG